MDDRLCEIKHTRLDEKMDVHDKRLNNHGNRIDKLEYSHGRFEERLGGLITQLAALNSTLKWFMGLLIASFVGFFFYAVQSGLFI